MTERELLIVTAAVFRAAGSGLEESWNEARNFIKLTDQKLAETQETSSVKPPVIAERQKEVDALYESLKEPEAPKRRSKKEEITNPLTAPKDMVISPPLAEADPTPPKPPEVKPDMVMPKEPADIPVGPPPFVEYDTNVFGCASCKGDKLRVRVPRSGKKSRAVCLDCGFVEEFELNAEDREAIIETGSIAEESPAAKKAKAAAQKPAASRSQVLTDRRTGEKSIVERAVNEEGEPVARIIKIGSEAVEAETTILTPDKPTETQPIEKSLETRKTELPNAPLPCSPRINDLVKEIANYEPPPVNLDAARTEMKAIVADWPVEKRMERYEKLFSQPWAGQPNDAALIDALVNASLGRIVAE